MSSASPSTVIGNALADINAVPVGEAVPGEVLALGLSHFNRMLGQWKTRKLFAYYTQVNSWAWATTKASYSIGIAGNAPDFSIGLTGDRPVFIEAAKLVLNSGTPNSEIPIEVINAKDFSRISVPTLQTTLVQRIWYQATYPNGTIWPFPQPTNTSYQLKLYWWEQLNEVTAANVAVALNFPPGMEDAVTLTLSERLCIPFGKTVPDELKVQARQARAFIQALNTQIPKIATDAPSSGSPRGSSLSGFLSRNF